MEFTEKYISDSENTTKPDASKILLSDDAYAIGEMIQELLKHVRNLKSQ